MKSIDMDGVPRKASTDKPLSRSLEHDNNFECDIIKCPICGFDYSHIKQVNDLCSDEYKAWDGRGSCITITFDGECGHVWNLCIGYHKGQNFAFTDAIKTAVGSK